MTSAMQKNTNHLPTVTQIALLGAVAASLTWGCVSSNNDKGTATGGTPAAQGGIAAPTGGVPAGSTGGTPAVTGGTPAVTSYPACSGLTGALDGCSSVPNPAILAISDTCSIGLWAGDQSSGGGFFAPWCTGTTPTTTDGGAACTLTYACSGGSIHVTGSYLGGGDGNAGFGTFLESWSDAGAGCKKMDINSFTGVTMDVVATAVPSDTIYFGLTLGDGNSAEGTILTATGTPTKKFPFGALSNKNKCGSVTGPGATGVAGIWISFQWFQDGLPHPVDVTFSNIGFY